MRYTKITYDLAAKSKAVEVVDEENDLTVAARAALAQNPGAKFAVAAQAPPSPIHTLVVMPDGEQRHDTPPPEAAR